MTDAVDCLLAIRDVRALAASGEARALRESANLSLRDIAEALDVSHVTVARWESGESRPTGRLARRYADVLRRLAA